MQRVKKIKNYPHFFIGAHPIPPPPTATEYFFLAILDFTDVKDLTEQREGKEGTDVQLTLERMERVRGLAESGCPWRANPPLLPVHLHGHPEGELLHAGGGRCAGRWLQLGPRGSRVQTRQTHQESLQNI